VEELSAKASLEEGRRREHEAQALAELDLQHRLLQVGFGFRV